MAVLLLALFPVLIIFDTRLGALALIASIVLLYRGATAKRLARVRMEERPPQSAWRDPWGPGSSGSPS